MLTMEWVRRFSLVEGERGWTRLKKSKFPLLAARAYPDCNLPELELVAEWNTWLFIFDDQCDETALGKDSQGLGRLNDRFMEIVGGAVPSVEQDPALCQGLHDLIERLRKVMDKQWMARFAKSVGEYLESTVWESTNRRNGRTPSLSEYVLMRPYTGGLYTDIDLIEFAHREEIRRDTEAGLQVIAPVRLPLHIRERADIKALALKTNNVVCWTNDPVSLLKEKGYFGDVHNLVEVLRKETGVDGDVALKKVVELTNGEVVDFLRIKNELTPVGESADAVKTYIAILEAWMRGNLDWSFETHRYTPEVNPNLSCQA